MRFDLNGTELWRLWRVAVRGRRVLIVPAQRPRVLRRVEGGMKLAMSLLAVLSALALSAAPVGAQDQAQGSDITIEQRSGELARWLKEYREWERWFELWGNRVAKNPSGFEIWERKKRPEPPAWLDEACRDGVVADDQLTTACDILRTWDDQPMQIVQRRGTPVATSGGKPADTVVKSSFLRRVHLTGLWPRAQYPGTAVYGIVGMQIAVLETGRWTLPATGLMLVMLPDGRGGHDWKPATTVGAGYRLFDFVPPSYHKPFSLHVNIARAFVHGLHDERTMFGAANINFVGFSVSRKRRG